MQVPSVIVATIEPPSGLSLTGPGVLIEARVVRRKDKASLNEAECVRLSEELVFLEFQLHQQLMLKLKVSAETLSFERGFLSNGNIAYVFVLADARSQCNLWFAISRSMEWCPHYRSMLWHRRLRQCPSPSTKHPAEAYVIWNPPSLGTAL